MPEPPGVSSFAAGAGHVILAHGSRFTAAYTPLNTETTHGFVLRVRPLTDTSLIVHWLTSDAGRVATVAKGARQAKSPFAGKLDLAFECKVAFQRSRRSDLHILREVTLLDPRPVLRTDYAYLKQLAYAVALLEQMTERDTPLPEVFELFAGFLAHLPRQPAQPRNIYAFELKLLASQGMAPDLPAAVLSAGARTLMENLLSSDWPEIAQIRANRAEVDAVRRFLHGFLIAHCAKVPLGRERALATVEFPKPEKKPDATAAGPEPGP